MPTDTIARLVIQTLGRAPTDRVRARTEAGLPPSSDPREQELFLLLDGTRALEDVLTQSPLPPARMQRALQKLKVLGLLEVVLPPQPADGPARLPPPQSVPTPPPVPRDKRLTPEQRREIEAEQERISGLGHYEILSVPQTATAKEIQRAYFLLARRFHPDVFFGRDLGDLERVLMDVTQRHFEAYCSLRDTLGRRQEYDAALGPQAAAQTSGPASPEKPDSMKDDAARQFEKGIAYFQRNDYARARPFVELACAFDPENAVYRDHRDRIRKMLGVDGGG